MNLKMQIMINYIITQGRNDQHAQKEVSRLKEILIFVNWFDRPTKSTIGESTVSSHAAADKGSPAKISSIDQSFSKVVFTEITDGIIIEDVQDELLKDCYQSLNPWRLQGHLIDGQNVDIGLITVINQF
ncbi:hypothetical protein GYMLUDRAFT_65345 [Collybiopsis luxurians FD-317 M1]|uniref:Uncharacterized protein n=1 Tax=Collybiopsis luxurians FD-317 M1 TaxID=944289 RepID=A0A0D0C6E4_9AGAR|nr:hypothetical protein GYMLUDRAFT_65345 [Collybiopsis luxurians FD-317 M1]